LSQIISEYYRITTKKTLNMIAGSGDILESNRRFSNFNASLKFIASEVYIQTLIFNAWYVLANPGDRASSAASIQAVRDFISWCSKGGDV
jgi:hypothetical protein